MTVTRLPRFAAIALAGITILSASVLVTAPATAAPLPVTTMERDGADLVKNGKFKGHKFKGNKGYGGGYGYYGRGNRGRHLGHYKRRGYGYGYGAPPRAYYY